LWAIADGLELLQLFEGAGVGAVEGAFVAEEEAETGFVGDAVESPGQAVVGGGVVFEVREGAVYVFGEAVHFIGEDAGFDG
jgi:hypothetical protein